MNNHIIAALLKLPPCGHKCGLGAEDCSIGHSIVRACTDQPSDSALGLSKAKAIDAILGADDEHAQVLFPAILTAIDTEKKRLANKRKHEEEAKVEAKKARVVDALIEQRQRELNEYKLPYDVSVDEKGFVLGFLDEVADSDSPGAEAANRICEWVDARFGMHDGWVTYGSFEADINDDDFAVEVAKVLRKMDAKDAKACLCPASTRK